MLTDRRCGEMFISMIIPHCRVCQCVCRTLGHKLSSHAVVCQISIFCRRKLAWWPCVGRTAHLRFLVGFITIVLADRHGSSSDISESIIMLGTVMINTSFGAGHAWADCTATSPPLKQYLGTHWCRFCWCSANLHPSPTQC